MEKRKEELFQEYKGSKAALYGLGTETEKALFWLKDRMEIIYCLLDRRWKRGWN